MPLPVCVGAAARRALFTSQPAGLVAGRSVISVGIADVLLALQSVSRACRLRTGQSEKRGLATKRGGAHESHIARDCCCMWLVLCGILAQFLDEERLACDCAHSEDGLSSR